MTDYFSSVFEKQTASAAGKVSTAELGGRVRLVHGAFTPAAAVPAGSVVKLVRLPFRARLLPMSEIHFEAGQDAALTVKIGDSLDDDRYFTAAAPGATAKTIVLNANRLGDYVTPAETELILTTGAKPLAAGKKITFDLLYVTD